MTISIVTSWRERRARGFVETASTPGAQRRLRVPGRLRPVLERGGGRTNRARDAVREEGGGAFVVCERIRRSSRGADRREASPREGGLARRCRASVSFRPRRLHEVRGDGVAARVNRARTARRSASRTRRRRRPSWTIRRRARGTGRCTRCWRASHPRGTTVSPGEKASARGNGSISTREMEDPGRDAARDPYAFTAEIRRILDAVRAETRRAETRWDDGDEMG